MKIPNNIFYTKEHMWVKPIDSDCWQAGITDYAQDLLGDIVFLEPPALNTGLIAGTPSGFVESVKTGSDLHAPSNGIVTKINTDLLNSPEEINNDPYKNWIFEFKPTDPADLTGLLKADEYRESLE